MLNKARGIHPCPRCIGGQTAYEQDLDGNWSEVCMQCGCSRDIPTSPRYSASSPTVIKQARMEGK